MVWYSHLLKNLPQFVVIHTVKVFGVVNKTEIDGIFGFFFGTLLLFFHDPVDVGNLISGSSAFYLEIHGSHTVEALLEEY